MEGRELAPPENLDETLDQLTIRRAARPHRTRELLRMKAERTQTMPGWRRRGAPQ
jgi:hypothetical protein